MKPYPLRTKPFFRDYIWGGRKLGTVLGKEIPSEGDWAESWEFVDHAEHQSVVTNGPLAGQTVREIAQHSHDWLFGCHSIKRLPLLLKYLDCNRVLSVQVHPDDAYAEQMDTPDFGKTEAWYIVDAEPGSVLYAGLKEGVTKADLRAAVEAGRVEETLHEIQPKAGDCLFIPAGTVHALGAGLLVAEIQQASNTTFRLFDWNRLGADGKPRPLHVDQALEVIDFAAGPQNLQVSDRTAGAEVLVDCDKFILTRHQGSATLTPTGSFRLLTAPHGGVEITWDADGPQSEKLGRGESVMLPAAMPDVQVELQSGAVLLEMSPPV